VADDRARATAAARSAGLDDAQRRAVAVGLLNVMRSGPIWAGLPTRSVRDRPPPLTSAAPLSMRFTATWAPGPSELLMSCEPVPWNVALHVLFVQP
jgi:hypothetical protein